MMKKFITTALAACMAMTLCACTKEGHVHTYSETWYYDENYHWQIPTCGDTDEVGNMSVHNFVDGVCHLCGYSPNGNAAANEYYDVTYGVDGEGGSIKGEKLQRVKRGGAATAVEAVPDEGFLFVMWSDGEIDAERQDTDIRKDLSLLAYFEPDPDNPNIDDDENYGNDHPEEEENNNTEKGQSEVSNGLVFTELKSLTDDTVTGYSVRLDSSNHSSDIKIPAKHKDHDVLQIEDNAFENSSVQTVEIPDTVTKVGHQAFMNCKSLRKIEIPDSVLDVGTQAFQNCSALQTVKLSDQLEGVWYKMFYSCSALQEIELPDSVTSIGRYAFYRCTSLKTVKFGEGIKNCGAKCFGLCTGLTAVYVKSMKAWCETSFDFNSFSLTSTFESNPLYYAKQLYMSGSSSPVTELNIPDGTKEIGSFAFFNCNSITKVTVPGSVKLMGMMVFVGCENLEEVQFEEGLISAEYSLFQKCSKLKKVTFPDSLQVLGEDPDALEKLQNDVFESCPSLTEVTFGSGLEKMDCRLFANCPQMTDIKYTGTAEKWQEIVYKNWASQCASSITVHCLASNEDIVYTEKWVLDGSLKYTRYEMDKIVSSDQTTGGKS